MSGHFTMNTAFGKTWGDNEDMRIIRIWIRVSTEYNRMYRFDQHSFFSGFQQQCLAELLDLVPLTTLLLEYLENQLPF